MAEYHIQSKTRFIVTGTNSASNIRKAMTVLFNLLDSAGPGAGANLGCLCSCLGELEQ
jgi:hypothetical protein